MVLEKVKYWGDYIIDKENLDKVDIIGQKSKLEKVEKVIKVSFEKSGNNLSYKDTKIEDYNPDEFRKYLYRTFRHGQYDITPTAKPSSAEKMNRRWGQWFGTYARKKNDFWNEELIKNIHNKILEPSEDQEKYEKEVKIEILKDMKEKYDSIDGDAIFTITLLEDNKERYLGDIDIFRKIFINESVKKFHEKLKVDARGEGKCYLCGKEDTVYGFASPFAIFTLKPKGFASNFLRENAWKQFPICRECGISCIKGREFLDTFLKYTLLGYYSKGNYIQYTYYVIPTINYTNKDKKELLGEIYSEVESYKGEDYKDGLLAEEDPTFGFFSHHDDVNLSFIFCKEKQKDYFDVVEVVNEVPPSWISKVYSKFKEINLKKLFSEDSIQELLGEKWNGGLKDGKWDGEHQNTNLKGIIRTFYPASDNTGKHDKEFLDILGNILSHTKFSKDYLVKAFIREIRSRHVNEYDWSEKVLVLKSLYLYEFLSELNLLKGVRDMKEEKKLEVKKSDKYRKKMGEFFEEFSKALNTNAKKAVFLEGVLTRFLLDIQSGKRNSTPFRTKLRGLRLDEMKVKNLFPEITEKLRQYDAPYYSWLEEMISEHFIAADNDGWKINKNEISYYFALGLNLGRTFKIKEEEKEGDQNE